MRWTTDQMLRQLVPGALNEDYRDPSGNVLLAQVYIHPGWIGQTHSKLETDLGIRVAFITRLGEGMVATSRSVHQEGDLVHILINDADTSRVEAELAKSPEEI